MKKFIYLLLVAFMLISCSSNKVSKLMPIEKKMQIADDFFERGKYHKAIPYYESVAFEKNSLLASKAQLKLADCYFNQNKFMDALFEYEHLIKLYNDAEEINRAYFQIGVCYWEESMSAHYTQEETRSAIDAFETFIEKFPFDKRKKDAIEYIQKCHYKLLKKKYYNGYAYYKMWDYPAAMMYFNEIIELGNTNKVDKLSLFYAARIYITREDRDNAILMQTKLNNKYPDSKETEKINKLIERKLK
ncbi:MAG: outer membrane protein assembly factor BamD [Candidatus Cloacimonetes bacterium]|nr:outer membrane protein assembly factor BamD [Candidatus Cloacimonadota bacterium]MCF7814276.1 outer membrane protein assembly factor BamD [Candidatus Cloacimonadota bacterium]MCF7868937.1 outer membrane protein assembly factor BamD [Candidatus Cloacimonadota bacterium]MCF7884317.1 outer membrane protein assembly factor BamD [Candidatus Cloacimonadota bacterium]